MKLKLLILAVALCIVNAEYKSYEGYKVFKIVPEAEKDVKILKGLEKVTEYQFWTDVIQIGEDVRIMVSPEKLSKFEEYLTAQGIKASIAIEDVQKSIDAQLRRPKINRLNNNYDWNYYQNLEEIHKWMDEIVDQHADVASIVTIGTSREGRDIKGVKIDYRKRENATVGMLEGGIHAREWISPATITWIINEFLTSTDAEVRALAENIVWHIFPVVNPDGYEYTFTNNRMWRKNRNNESFTSCSQWNLNDDMSNGVDLNRNFDFLWMTVGASNNPCAETYAGTVANSELETRAIINYVESLQSNGDHLLYYFAFHSFSQLVLVPYSHVAGAQVLEAPNYGDMFEIAIKGMDKLKERNGTEYIVGTSADILYHVSGSSFDWAKGEADIPIVYLFELRDDGDYGFLLPPELIKDNNREIVDGLIEMDRVTRQLGYYHRSSGFMHTLNAIIILLSLIIVM
ncbi:zinc carboxypeptidase-like [Pectinophora gossypiella]|uniref:zinc carboxypeptidase-like n=1 Tax=Pectinophora gossypiella TaxID=13191 RepID=UPI00214E5EF4|nr:zinc carboxypeptidase-like [Pectinophora gossypiella]